MELEEGSFREWLIGNQYELGVDLEYVQPDDAALRWFHEIFLESGPIQADELSALIEARRREVCWVALSVLQREIGPDLWGDIDTSIQESRSLFVPSQQGFYFVGQELRSLSVGEALVEIGDKVQDEIIYRDREVWPLCDVHRTGLHPRLQDERAVWWCESGKHSVREIGSDRTPGRSSRKRKR